MDTLIEAENVTLRFSAPTEKKGSLKKWVLDAIRGRVAHNRFTAVDGVSFKIERGEAVGLLGRNGAGKSTLLKLVTGIVAPTEGSIRVRGQVAPLLALGNGLDPALTGRENIYLNGAILGYRKEWLEAHEAEIVAFSELGDFIDAPVRTYSSGMTMRLAFSIASAATPEILILDEVLAVGDAPFQAKCRARIREIIADGATVFFVSHSLPDIVRLCSRAIWLEKGRIKMDGPAADVADAYLHDIDPGSAASGGGPAPVFRFRSERYGEEFLTIREAERREVAANSSNWSPAGVAYRAFPRPAPGTVPVHRFYAKGLRSHFFTTDAADLDALRTPGSEWSYEGISHHVYPSRTEGAVPVRRFRNETTGKFLFVADDAEADSLRAPGSGWSLEKTAFWALPEDRSGADGPPAVSNRE